MHEGRARHSESGPPTASGRTAYIVLNHAPAAQVERLVGAIRSWSPTAHVVVAHDARRTPLPGPTDRHVDVWCHRLPTDWGSWELVEASLGALERAHAVPGTEWFVLVSGHDYPTRNLAGWERLLTESGGGWVGTARPLRYEPRWGRRPGVGDDDLTRYAYAWYRLPTAPFRLPSRLSRLRARLSGAVFLRVEPALSLRVLRRGRGTYVGVGRVPAPFGPGSECVKGSQWLAMDRRHVEQVLAALGPGTRMRRIFRRSIIPDESAIQSVLHQACPPLDLPPVSYLEALPDGSVRVLGASDAHAVVGSGAPFCRKVETAASATLLDLLDRGGPA